MNLHDKLEDPVGQVTREESEKNKTFVIKLGKGIMPKFGDESKGV